MVRPDLSQRDASERAASELEYLIDLDKKKKEPEVPMVSSEQAMSGQRMLEVTSQRDVTRVLFVSRNTELLNPTQQSLDGYIDISDLFDEVHILILRQGIAPKQPALRVADNVWIYTAAAKYWWQTPQAGVRLASEQLEFATGFRPDLIVARDPFESALVASKLGEKYDRPTQLHILDDYSAPGFAKKSPHNFWRLFLPVYTVPKFTSVRTLTAAIETVVREKFTIPDIETLPRYQNYEALIEQQSDLVLKDKYKGFVFFLVYVGKLGHESTLFRAIDAARFVLTNPRVGLIVLGDGPARPEFEKRAKLLGIAEQVIFEPRVSDPIPYLKAANLMIVTDTDAASEEWVLKAAACGTPMIMATTETRTDTFLHGESAYICEPENTQAFTSRIKDMLNDVSLRNKFGERGQAIIRERFHHDPAEYQVSYRKSIEQAFFVGTEMTQSAETE